jgi:lycopene beta-cyclase
MNDTMQTYELVIIGAGLSGLSISNQLIANDWCQTTLLIDSRQTYQNDKSWSFWLPADAQLQKHLNPLIAKRWVNWTMDEVLKHTPKRPYCYIPSEDFYQFSLKKLKNNPWINLNLNTQIQAIKSFTKHHEIQFKNQASIRARYIIDTRPPILECQNAPLWQVFLGQEIKSIHALFDEDTMHLMHELRPTSSGACFQYILPFNKHHALIETTYIGNKKIDSSELYPLLATYVEKNFSTHPLLIGRQEQGVLPMGIRPLMPKASSRYCYAGMASGAIRPSTGYAFLRIQKQAEYIASSLCKKGKLPAFKKDPWFIRNMDNIFLKVCQKHPSLIAGFFQAFAHKVPAPKLIEFLSDECNFLNCTQVALALPKGLFLKNAVNYFKEEFNA